MNIMKEEKPRRLFSRNKRFAVVVMSSMLAVAVVSSCRLNEEIAEAPSMGMTENAKLTPSPDGGWEWFVEPVGREEFAESWETTVDNIDNSPVNQRPQNVASDAYDEIGEIHENRAVVAKDGKYGYIDANGDVRVGLTYDDAHIFSEGKAAVKLNNEWAYIDIDGNLVIDFYPYSSIGGEMLYVGEFHNGLAFVSKDLYSVIDDNGNNIFLGGSSKFFISICEYNADYDAIPAFVYADEKMIERKYGFVRLDGTQRVEPVFDYVYGVNNSGFAKVEVGTDMDGDVRIGVIKLDQIM